MTAVTAASVLPRHPTGIVILSGYGLRIAVERGHLVVEDGVGADRRREVFSRIDQGLKRLVIIGHAGTISLDAIRWLHGVGVPLIHLDTNGTIFLVATPQGAAAPAQRRAQIRALESPIGIDIARGLIASKIEGQSDVLRCIPRVDEAQEYVAGCGQRARRARTLTEVREIEPLAARAYWRAWQRVPVRFDPQDAKRRPRHWGYFGSRISPLTAPSPRQAVNPANAALNYLYAILEAEARIAALAVGLDPLLGLLHADRPNRDSLACDLMEPVRPAVDRYVLELLAARTFTKDDVFELLDGQCKLLPPLTHELATTASQWAQLVQPIAGEVADRLGGSRRRPRRWGIRSGKTRRRSRGPTGVIRRFTVVEDAAGGSSAMSRRIRALRAANREWERIHGRPDPAESRTSILAWLAGMTLRQLHEATGLTRALCTRIRRGDLIPHPRYWQMFVKAVERSRCAPSEVETVWDITGSKES